MCRYYNTKKALYLQSLNNDKHLPQSPFTGQILDDILLWCLQLISPWLDVGVTGLPPSGLDGAAEADAGGGHRRQEGAGTRTLSQVPLLFQTDKYAHQYMRKSDHRMQYSNAHHLGRSTQCANVSSDRKWHPDHLLLSYTYAFQKKFWKKSCLFTRTQYIVGKSKW